MHLYRSLVVVVALLIAPCAFAQVPSQIPAGSGGGGITTLSTGIFGGTSASIAIGATDYITNGVSPSVVGARANAQVVASYTGTAKNLYCSFVTPSVTAGPTITVEVNAVGSALTMVCGTGATTCNNTSNTASFTAGQLLDIQVNNAANAAATGQITCSFQTS